MSMTREKFIALVLTTVSEGIGLVLWLLIYFMDTPLIAGVDNRIVATLCLFVGLYGERVSFAWYARDKGLSPNIKAGEPLPFGQLVLITVTEVLIWAVWLPLHFYNVWLGLVFLSVFMLLEHTGEMAALRVKPFMDYLFKFQTIFFTAVEVVGSVAWVITAQNGQYALGIAIVAVTLFVEHFLQGAGLEPETDETPTPQPA